MRRPQFTLKTLLWLMAVVAAFGLAFWAGAHRERDLLKTERKRLIDWSYELDVQQNRFDKMVRKQHPEWCETFFTKEDRRRAHPDLFDSDGNFR